MFIKKDFMTLLYFCIHVHLCVTCALLALKDSFSLEMLFSTTSSLTRLSFCWTCSSWIRTSSDNNADSWACRTWGCLYLSTKGMSLLIMCNTSCTRVIRVTVSSATTNPFGIWPHHNIIILYLAFVHVQSLCSKSQLSLCSADGSLQEALLFLKLPHHLQLCINLTFPKNYSKQRFNSLTK